jgi:hypothetical protein
MSFMMDLQIASPLDRSTKDVSAKLPPAMVEEAALFRLAAPALHS